MQLTPHNPNSILKLTRKELMILASAQRRLLEARKRGGVPVDPRSVENLERLNVALTGREQI